MDIAQDATFSDTIAMRDELFIVFENSGDIEVLESVITLTNEVVENISPYHPYRFQCTIDLLIYWDLKYQQTQVLGDLHQAIIYAEDLLEATSPDHLTRHRRLGHISLLLYTRYLQTGFMDDLNQAIFYTEQALSTARMMEDDRVMILNTTYKMFQSRFEHTGLVADLHCVIQRARDLMGIIGSQMHIWIALGRVMGGGNDDREHAISSAKLALEAMSDHAPGRAKALSILSMAFYLKYQQTEAMDDIRLAISFAKESRAATPLDDPERATFTNNLNTLLDWRQRLDGAMHDLGIMMDESMLAKAPENVKILGDLATKLSWRFEQSKDPNDKARAISCKEQAFAHLHGDGWAAFLNGLENGLELRYKAAISYASVLLEAMGQAHPERGPLLTDLADTLFTRYSQTETMDILQLAISYTQDACTYQSPDQIRHINNLATLLYTRYNQTHVMEDLQQGILCGARALREIGHDNPLRFFIMNNQAIRLRTRYDETLDMADLTQAISYTKIILAEAPRGHPYRVDILLSMSDLMVLKYKQTMDVDDMKQVVPYAKEALVATPLDHPDLAHHLNDLATKFYWRYKQTAAIGDINQAESLSEQALKATEKDPSSRALYLSNLAMFRHSIYQRFGDISDINMAISLCKLALVTRVSPRDPPPTRYLVQLARYFEHKYNQTKDIDDIRHSVMYGEEALIELPHDHSERVHLLAILGRGLSIMHEQAGVTTGSSIPQGEGELAIAESLSNILRVSTARSIFAPIESTQSQTTDIEHLQQAISYSDQALEATPHDHPERSARLQLSETLKSRYQHIVTIPDLHQAMLRDEEALAAIPDTHPDRHRLLENLISNVLLLPVVSQDEITVDKLGKLMEYVEEWAAGSGDDSGRSDKSAPLASLFYLRFLKTDAIDDLQQAIVYNGEVVARTELAGDPTRNIFLIRQAMIMYHRYLHNKDMDDLERAISYGKGTLRETPPGHHQVDQHGLLATCFSARYDKTGDISDLDQVVQHRELALAAAPPPGVLVVKSRLRELSKSLRDRFDQTREMGDLDRAIWAAEEGYDSPSGNNATNLYILLSARYERSGDTSDLNRCIKYASIALSATPEEDSKYSRAGCLTNLAGGLYQRFSQYGDLEDLNHAISLSEEALAAVPKEYPDRVGHLQNTAGLLAQLYKKTGSIGSLEKAIVYGEQGLAAARDLQQRGVIQLLLGDIFHSKYTFNSDMDSLQQAISYNELALDAFPPDHRAYGIAYLFLGKTYLIRSQQMDSPEDLTKSVFAFKQAWGCSHLMPRDRVCAARGAASVLICCPGGAMESYALLEGAILLLPEVNLRSLDGGELMSTIIGLHGLAADAASSALEAEIPAYVALKLLELSRGISTGIAIDCRSDLSDLSKTDRGLYNKFNNLRAEIDTPLQEWMTVNYRVSMVDAIRRRREGVDKMARLVAEIRELPGHEGFQLPLSATKLMSMATDGAIVTFSSSAVRSDAIVVTSTKIISIPLPKLLFTEIEKRLGGEAIAKLSSGTFRTYASRNNKLRDLLFWLWEAAVWPVLEHLQYTANGGPSADDLPHIVWTGTGLLGVAPFHAAGDYSRNGNPLHNTLSYAVSSYTPTIKALSYARDKELTILGGNTGSDSRMLLVSMPTTPGETDLPDVDIEVQSILEITKGSIVSTHMVAPSAAQVLNEFESYGALHLACHGISNATSPSKSHLLLLKNGNADPLEIYRISRRNTATSAQLAYLSACSTAESTGVHFADECLHIASGFQLAGFSHVLASMWPAESKVCVAVSTEFYRSLFNGRGEGHRKVRTAFHEAVKKAQEKYRRSPLKWAPFIHMGA